MSWELANRDYLLACLDRVEERLRAHAEGASREPTAPDWPPWDEEQGRLPAVLALCRTFGLTPFERDVLLLTAGMELQGSFPAACADAQGDPRLNYPTLGLALAALGGASWDALLPSGSLRRWALIELEPSPTLVHARLRVDESVWQALLGLRACPARLLRHLRPLPPPAPVAPGHVELGKRVAAAFAEARFPLVQLVGECFSDQVSVAGVAGEALGLGLDWLPADTLPSDPGDAETLATVWARDQRIAPRLLLLEWPEDLPEGRTAACSRLLAASEGPVVVATSERRSIPERPGAVFEVARPSAAEQVRLWAEALGAGGSDRADGDRESLSRDLGNRFDLDGVTIATAARQGLLGLPADAGLARTAEALADACRAQVRSGLDGLATRVPLRARWGDLVVPRETLEALREVEAHVRHRPLVHDTWGLAGPGVDVLGTSVLFAGASGTGKTLAAQVLAGAAGFDLYRVDLSAVVSKYIGETEKNLRRVFDAADRGGVALLFDEADALFGKRGEVKDSHDRYANLEVSYLLQRLERFRGLGILTSNLKDALDPAFLRRLHFVVEFEFPTTALREEIWRRALPPAVPSAGLDPAVLARLDVAGGSIRMISLNAAYLAAAEPERRLRMWHVVRAARRECAKLHKPFTPDELPGWRRREGEP